MVYDQSESPTRGNEKAINDWLPITSSRNAKWWYSAFHNVTAMVGAGVLSLPYAMSELGWGPGVTIMALSWIITLYTLWQMVQMHEVVPGKRFDRYHELGQHAFGEKLGLWIIVPQQLTVQVGTNIVYMVTGGQSLKKFHNMVCPNCKEIKLTYFIMIFASVNFVLAHLPNFNSITGVSLAAAVMSLCYSTIAWAASVEKGVQPDVDYSYKASTSPGKVFNFLAALGEVAFSYAGHNVVLEIQATIPSTPEKPSKGPMWKGVVVAYIVLTCLSSSISLVAISIHNVSWDMLPILWRSSQLLWRICICTNNILYPLHHLAYHLQTQKIQLSLDNKLGMHCSWFFSDGSSTHWRAEINHHLSQGLLVLLVILFIPAEGVPLDFSLAPEALNISSVRDLLILPSDIKYFVKVSGDAPMPNYFSVPASISNSNKKKNMAPRS
ncbi:hypothetical protein CRYUN_Cryun06bG0134300 [Craigia yunnanensis]